MYSHRSKIINNMELSSSIITWHKIAANKWSNTVEWCNCIEEAQQWRWVQHLWKAQHGRLVDDALVEVQQCRLAEHSWKAQHWRLVNCAVLVEGANVSIGSTLVEGATLEIGGRCAWSGATVKFGEWRSMMPLLLEPSSNSIDSTGIEKQRRQVACPSEVRSLWKAHSTQLATTIYWN